MTSFLESVKEIRTAVGLLVPYAERSPGSFAKPVKRLSGIEDFHIRPMRHTLACQWCEQGGNLAALQQILGHANIETTQQYARLSDTGVMREAQRIGRVSGVEA